MNRTVVHTEYLLTLHPCVIIPGFGAILSREVSATVDANGNVTPPHRRYIFNPSITESDGLLEASVARAARIPYERAVSIIAEEVKAMQHELTVSGTLSLGRIGTIRRADDAVTFDPLGVDMLTPLASWLTPIRHNTFINDIEPEISNIIARATPSPWRRFARATAAIASVIAIAIIASTPITVKNADYASTALPAISAPKSAYVPSTKPPVLTLTIDNEVAEPVDTATRKAYQAERLAQKTAEDNTPPIVNASTKPSTDDITINDGDRYCVIVASVESVDEANDFIRRATRKHAGQYGYLQAGDRYRIYAATANTRGEAQALADKLSTRFQGAWVVAR